MKWIQENRCPTPERPPTPTPEREEGKSRILNYCFTMRDTLQEGKLKEKFEVGQKERIEAFLQATLDLLDSPSSVFGSKEDFRECRRSWKES